MQVERVRKVTGKVVKFVGDMVVFAGSVAVPVVFGVLAGL